MTHNRLRLHPPHKSILDRYSNRDTLVVFADMLGFSHLIDTTCLLLPPRVLQRVRTVSRGPLEQIRYSAWYADQHSRARYESFQKIVSRSVRELNSAHRGTTSTTSIIFSDSLYVFFYSNRDKNEPPWSEKDVVRFSKRLMQRCIAQRVPIRLGIGRGTAVRFNFTTYTTPGGDIVSAAPFLGSGILNAYRAQERRKGLRILIDYSAEEVFARRCFEDVVYLGGNDINDISYEINYLRGCESQWDGILRNILAMRRQAPVEARAHYKETVKAIKRMKQRLLSPSREGQFRNL